MQEELFNAYADVEPKTLTEIPIIFITKARVIPNINGEFLLSILNVTEAEVMITARKVLGHVRQAGEIPYGVHSHLAGATIGENLSASEESVIIIIIIIQYSGSRLRSL